jgi:hypothetical protein
MFRGMVELLVNTKLEKTVKELGRGLMLGASPAFGKFNGTNPL